MKKPNINLDFEKIKGGLILPTTIGAIVIFIGFLLNILLSLLSYMPIVGEMMALMGGIGGIILSILGYLFFLLLFVWVGYRASRKYHADVTTAGISAAFSYAILGVLNLMLTLILTLLNVVGIIGYTALSPGVGGEQGDIAVALLGGATAGITGILANLCCALGLIPFGALVNFVVGSIGGIIGAKK